MTKPQQPTDHRRFRLAGNDNETIVADDELDVAGHRLLGNDDETIVADDELDVAGHRLAGNDDETMLDAERVEGDADDPKVLPEGLPAR